MYQFARCQTHPIFPDLQGWYLVLKPDDVDTLMDLHNGISSLYSHKFRMDPHLTKDEIASIFNPIHLAAKWLQAAEKLLLTGSVMINSSGGMLPPSSVEVLTETQSQTMSWPDIYEDEVITISRWPEGHHYYLSSNKNRVFVPSKYIKYEAALQAAKRYTDNIREKC